MNKYDNLAQDVEGAGARLARKKVRTRRPKPTYLLSRSRMRVQSLKEIQSVFLGRYVFYQMKISVTIKPKRKDRNEEVRK